MKSETEADGRDALLRVRLQTAEPELSPTEDQRTRRSASLPIHEP